MTQNQELFEKAEKAINTAFEATKKTMKTVSEKAGEAAHITQLYIEKVSLEHRVSKKFAELGNRIYTQAVRIGEPISIDDDKTKELVEDTKQLDLELARVEATIKEELDKKNSEKDA